jgi:hypothetical protein
MTLHIRINYESMWLKTGIIQQLLLKISHIEFLKYLRKGLGADIKLQWHDLYIRRYLLSKNPINVGSNLWFSFKMSRVETAARRLSILTKTFAVFLTRSRHDGLIL